MEQPITPEQASEKTSTLNNAIKALNWLIEEKFNGSSATVDMHEWQALVQKRVANWNWKDHYRTMAQMYEMSGWTVRDCTETKDGTVSPRLWFIQ